MSYVIELLWLLAMLLKGVVSGITQTN